MDNMAVRVAKIGKKFRIGERNAPYKTFRDALANVATAPIRRYNQRDSPQVARDFWALRDISFEVRKGEAIGIIGRNGAGKSTLLKILSRITEPTEGRAEIFGHVGSLLEVGTGFHQELTGGENIYLSGAILGMKKSEIDRNFDEIVKFAEVEKFLNSPFKHYSSGMQIRLAFSVAAFLDTEILMIDEVLAVGDIAFQKKCLGKMSDIARNDKKTIFFVSHNMAAVEHLCSRCILIDNGKLTADGNPIDIISQYMDILTRGSTDGANKKTSAVTIDNISLTYDDQKNSQLTPWTPCSIQLTFSNSIPLENCYINLHVDDLQGRHCIHLRTDFDGLYPEFGPGTHTVSVDISSLNLEGGSYVGHVRIVSEKRDIVLDSDKIMINVVREYEKFEGIDSNVAVRHAWKFD